MMNDAHPQQFEQIVAYLNGDLTASAKQFFETEMFTNPKLAEEVDLIRRVQLELSNKQKKILRDKLTVISAKHLSL